jgi:hypothetical protein
VLDDCNSSDRTIDRGIAVIKNSGPSAACMAGGRFHGIGTIRWNNGKVSRVPDNVSFGAASQMGMGRSRAAQSSSARHSKALDKVVIDPTVLDLCASPLGVGVLTAGGEIQIGHPSVGGVAFTP